MLGRRIRQLGDGLETTQIMSKAVPHTPDLHLITVKYPMSTSLICQRIAIVMASRVNANVVATIGFVVLKALLRSESRCKALTTASERAIGMVVVQMVRLQLRCVPPKPPTSRCRIHISCSVIDARVATDGIISRRVFEVAIMLWRSYIVLIVIVIVHRSKVGLIAATICLSMRSTRASRLIVATSVYFLGMREAPWNLCNETSEHDCANL